MRETLASIAIATLTLLAAASSASAAEPDQHGHMHSMDHRMHQPAQSAAPADSLRTVEIEARDTAFNTRAIRVHAGLTLRLVITNKGELRHEFAIGTLVEQRAHRAMMRQMPDMKHADDDMLTLEPGETRVLVHRFGLDTDMTFACNIPGHAEAGMTGRFVLVQP